jgi:methylated-DNA-protein-cysteine methyltransferase-like protein
MNEKQHAILMVLNAIPPGYVTSYGEVARRAGLPGYARMVCKVLRELPDRSATPWWRVIRADGCFGMDAECSAGREQRRRLQEEGIVITRERVNGPWW